MEYAQSEPGWTQPPYSSPDHTEQQFVTAHQDSQHWDFLLITFFNSFSGLLFSHQTCPSYGENHFLSMDSL